MTDKRAILSEIEGLLGADGSPELAAAMFDVMQDRKLITFDAVQGYSAEPKIEEDLWNRILDQALQPQCPSCGKRAYFTDRAHSWNETHGLDCGPFEHCYQEWAECSECGAQSDHDEIAKHNSKETV